MRRHTLKALAFGAGLWAGVAAAQAPGARVEELLELARRQNPELAAMGFEAEAARERVQPAGALPDPMGRIELRDPGNQMGNGDFNLLPARVGSTKYTVTQTIPLWGKRDLKREVAEADATQALARRSGTWAELAAKVKAAFAQYYLVGQSLKITQELLRLAGSLEQLAQARYADGLVPQQDVVRAQVERTALRSELLVMETEHHHAAARLNALLRRPPAAPLAEPQVLRPLPAPARLDYAALEARLLAANPQLAAQDAQVAAAEKNRELVTKNRYPDLTVGVSPIQTRNRVTEWELMFEVNIPLQQESRRAQEREAAAMASAARARKDAALNQISAELAESLSALDAARRLENLVATALLPQADLAFQAALAGYETGRLDFATLLEAQRQLRKAKLDRLKAQAEAQLRLAEIEKLLGEEL
ncbi:MAG: TolC family protein [Zoogloeaceae bacterium]|nr:TolC family protein [Zoogloeaceae bacterium]